MNLLCECLNDPQIVRQWGAEQWNSFLPTARDARLLGRSLHLFEESGLIDCVPQRVQDQFKGALAQTRYIQGQAMRELRHLVARLGDQGIELMALKGIAYLVAGLPPAAWRNLSDVDVLIAGADIERAERVLRDAGWVDSGEFDTYDQHYYRDWMHELPPLRHRSRRMEVDLHHNLAPPVSRIRIDAAKLWADAQEVEDAHGLSVKVPAASDLLLHNAIHLFMNDELRGGLRDVVDFRDLYRHFVANQADFERHLLLRADELGCGRALYYAVATAERLAGLTPSAAFLADLARHAPSAPVRRLMGWLIDRLLAPRRPDAASAAMAEKLLFLRSHWIRMPPGMLLRHLTHKLIKGRKPPPVAASDLPG